VALVVQVTPVKDQGNCGSCWAFASAETMESAWFLKTGKLVELSPQQCVLAVATASNPPPSGGGCGCGCWPCCCSVVVVVVVVVVVW
jgi:hypothetical protein